MVNVLGEEYGSLPCTVRYFGIMILGAVIICHLEGNTYGGRIRGLLIPVNRAWKQTSSSVYEEEILEEAVAPLLDHTDDPRSTRTASSTCNIRISSSCRLGKRYDCDVVEYPVIFFFAGGESR